ncbi:MAG TPA: DUF362 domain-containing protein [Candidatus Binatia bacterium]|jgi:uncharacterized protein (DUF362 family)|nr:DUF362 domain-containing protein [Candidatus Binatia bacterium]
MRPRLFNRRAFLQCSVVLAAGAPVALRLSRLELLAAGALPGPGRSDSKVAIVSCRSYGPEVREALAKSFDLLGGIEPLVKNKTVTVKLNLTGTNFAPFLGRPVGETYMTHETTALALGSLLFVAGARRVRFVESTQSKAELAATLALAGWDLKRFDALGKVEFENTRNLGTAKSYSHLRVPSGGYMFSAFDFNHCYMETDVMVSLAKLKNHLTAGVTLSLKNLFGITPNSLYGNEAGSEDATEGRLVLHDPSSAQKLKLPGLKDGITSADPTWRVPRITADVCSARPIHLAIIDGITSMSGGEGPWCGGAGPLKVTTPGLLIAGLNPVSTDAVGTGIMGYADPRVARGTKPFHFCDNHLLLAEQAGLGTADLGQIDVRGLTLEKARYPYEG